MDNKKHDQHRANFRGRQIESDKIGGEGGCGEVGGARVLDFGEEEKQMIQ